MFGAAIVFSLNSRDEETVGVSAAKDPSRTLAARRRHLLDPGSLLAAGANGVESFSVSREIEGWGEDSHLFVFSQLEDKQL
jgi:hypothetical protein